MSALLDALNRASRDKATAAALSGRAQPASGVEPSAALPQAAQQPAIASPPQPQLIAPAKAANWPALELAALQAPAAELQVPQAPIPATQFTDAMENFEPSVAGTELPTAGMSASAPVEEPVLSLSEQLSDHQRLTVSEPTLSEPLAASTSPPPPPMATPAPLESMNHGTRAAQNLLRAKAPPAPGGKKRVLVLAGVATALAMSLGSVMLGVWGDPMALVTGFGAPKQVLVVTPAPPTGQPPIEPKTVALTNVATAAEKPPSPPANASASVAAVTHAATPKPKPKPNPTLSSQPVKPGGKAIVATSDCPLGALAPDCKAPKKKRPASTRVTDSTASRASVQSRISGPTALEQGYSALTQGRLQDARQAYEQALGKNPEERDALLGLAYIAQQQGRKDEAQAFYKRVLRQEPGNPSAQTGLLMLNQPGDLQDFGNRSRDIAERNPESAAAQSMLGHALVRQDRLADARLAFARAQQLEPNVARHAFNLAVALDRLHRYDEARQYYERAVALVRQGGPDQTSGFPVADAQARLEQLRAASQSAPQRISN